jgi:hypothetical protein
MNELNPHALLLGLNVYWVGTSLGKWPTLKVNGLSSSCPIGAGSWSTRNAEEPAFRLPRSSGGAICQEVIAWQLRPDLTESLVIPALSNAARIRKPAQGLIHHTCSRRPTLGYDILQDPLLRAGVQQSMSRDNECYGNACMELAAIKT